MIRGSAAADEWVADWEEVLRRAGRSRFRTRRAAAIGAVAAVAAVAAVLLMPGIGIGGGLNALISGSPGSGFELSAKLSHVGRLIGTVSVRTSRLFVAVDPETGRIRSFVPRSRHGLPQPKFRWSIDLTGAASVSSVSIVRRGRVVERLCAPCRDGAGGTFLHVGRLGLFAEDLGKGTVVAQTSLGTARGTLRLTPRLR